MAFIPTLPEACMHCLMSGCLMLTAELPMIVQPFKLTVVLPLA